MESLATRGENPRASYVGSFPRFFKWLVVRPVVSTLPPPVPATSSGALTGLVLRRTGELDILDGGG